MATISISQLDTATQAKVDDLYEVAVVDRTSQTGYASRKLTAAQIATLIAQGVQFSGLSTEAKTIIAAINEAAQNGGTEVEANPTGEPTDTLETIGIDGTVYEVGGSSEPVSKTATGNPIHIEDAADAPIVSSVVTFEPKQNLHGYDKPWAGGAGKNLLPITLDGLKALNTSGTWTGNIYNRRSVNLEVLTDDGNNVVGIKVTGTATGGNIFFRLVPNTFDVQSGTILNGCPSGSVSGSYMLQLLQTDDTSVIAMDSGSGTNISANYSDVNLYIRIAEGTTVNGIVFKPMLRLATETDATFEPYSNICPIEGYTDCELEMTDDATTPTVTQTCTIDLDGTRYGGKVYPVTGKMSVGMGHIASYAGETIGEPWLSDRDEYVAGTTPSTGAEVVYTLATPTIVQLTPEQILTLEGTNNISTNMTDMSLEYITQDYQPLVKLIERSAGHHYSEQERVVGTWFGKPLYEKSWDVSIEIPSASANTWLSTGILTASVNCDTVVGGKLVDNSNQFILGNIGFIQQNTYFAINVPIGNRTITTVTIQYTKTTD